MKAERQKLRNVGKVLDEASRRLGVEPDIFELQAVLSIARAFASNLCLQDAASQPFRDELIALHPEAIGIQDATLCAQEIFEDREITSLLDGLSSASELSILLGTIHQWHLASSLVSDDSKLRKKLGAYYTPRHIVDGLFRDAWPLLAKERHVEDSLGELTFCDPACGAGQFIVTWLEGVGEETKRPFEQIASQFFGVDLDPVAIWLCRISVLFAVRQTGGNVSRDYLRDHFRVGNSLLGASWDKERGSISKRLIKEIGSVSRQLNDLGLVSTREEDSAASTKLRADAWFATCLSLDDLSSQAHWITEEMSETWGEDGPSDATIEHWSSVVAEYRVFHWFHEFPEVARRGGFDCMIGNPPYVNSIEREFKDEKVNAIYQDEDRTMRGSADLSYQFLRRSLNLIRENGSVYFLMPRATFAAPSLREFWENSRSDVWLRQVVLYDNHRLFEGASIFVSGALWHRCGETNLEPLSVVRYDRNDSFLWRRDVEHLSRRWWTGISGAIDGGTFQVSDSAPLLKDQFEISASMTTAEFYDCRSYIDDESSHRGGIPMITSGAIDPGTVKWGSKHSRILGKDYLSPMLPREAFDDGSPLRKRRERAERPKILIAGLAARIEAVLLKEPSQGAVSTLTITHPHDDCDALSELAEILNSDWVSLFLRHLLGANALGGGNITISKDFVMNLPLKRPNWRDLHVG